MLPNSVSNQMTWYVRPRGGISEEDLKDTATYGAKTYDDLSVCKILTTFVATLSYLNYFDSRRYIAYFGFEPDSQLFCSYPALQ